ncbi:MAG: Pyruvate phosphate dikinase [Candidatus Pacebacteria bacterium GW2011_GWB1_47_8]|nr:MAG: Pyruvate phosphate dikinase [Candidatus Pacebacteria bacterium GW2011_GWA1_46_10]KKU84319.1 MAG: Pyruvate phosphate dikinase [Candidatus Pacebacteria bacterium GW2011_GWB1_47_8]
MAKQWVFLFSALQAVENIVGREWSNVLALLGGKGANLFKMLSFGLPVPPGFTITTEACNTYLRLKRFPDHLWRQVQEGLAEIERLTGRKLGDPTYPLLVSCRSGAKFSMPGMMDTVLNIGMNRAVAAAYADSRVAYDLYRRLI